MVDILENLVFFQLACMKENRNILYFFEKGGCFFGLP